MTKKCFVPRCKSGYKTCKEKVSLFSVPNDENLLQQWQNAIGREDRVISKKDHVCEKHFKEDDITRYWVYQNLKDKLKTPRLKKDAVPCIFPVKATEVVPSTKPKRQRKKKQSQEDNNNQIILIEEVNNFEDLNPTWQPLDLFEKLWHGEVALTVPTMSWALHKVETCDARTIIISDIILSNGIPIYHKQIIMSDADTVSVIAGSSIISLKDQIKYFGNPVGLDTLDDLNILISSLHLLNCDLDEENIILDADFCEI